MSERISDTGTSPTVARVHNAKKRSWVLPAAMVMVAVITMAVVMALVVDDGGFRSYDSDLSSIGAMQQSCQEWIGSAEGERPPADWCRDMAGWMRGEASGRSMQGSMRWGGRGSMMWGDADGGQWWWLVMALMMPVFWGGLVWLIVILVRQQSNHSVAPSASLGAERSDPEAVLHERFARGEIDVDDYHGRIEALRAKRG